MNVSAWSIRNPIPSVMLFIMLTIVGLMAFSGMKIQNFPDIDLPTISVTVALPGASPAQLENDVARKIENSIATLQGLKHIYTKVQDGGATITAEFRLEKPTQEALDDVRSAVARVRGELPGDVRDPIVTKMDLAAQPVLAFTIASTRMDDEALSWFVDDAVAKKLLTVRGVGAVTRVGGVDRQVHVALDPLKLQALGATAADVSRQLRQVQTESAGGRTDLGGSEQPVRTLATVQSAQELAGLTLALSDGRHVRLDQVATVTDTIAEPRALAKHPGMGETSTAALKIVALPSQWVEPFIALSIIFVGVENVFLKVQPKRRAVRTFVTEALSDSQRPRTVRWDSRASASSFRRTPSRAPGARPSRCATAPTRWNCW